MFQHEFPFPKIKLKKMSRPKKNTYRKSNIKNTADTNKIDLCIKNIYFRKNKRSKLRRIRIQYMNCKIIVYQESKYVRFITFTILCLATFQIRFWTRRDLSWDGLQERDQRALKPGWDHSWDGLQGRDLLLNHFL